MCRHGDALITFNVHVTLVDEEETSHDLLTYCLQASWVNVQDVSQRWISDDEVRENERPSRVCRRFDSQSQQGKLNIERLLH